MYSSDRDGATQIYVERFADARTFDERVTHRLSDVTTGLFDAAPSPSGRRATAVAFRIDGYHLGVGSCEPSVGNARPRLSRHTPARRVAPLVTDDTGRVGPYHAWRTFYPALLAAGRRSRHRRRLSLRAHDDRQRRHRPSLDAGDAPIPDEQHGHRRRHLVPVRRPRSSDPLRSTRRRTGRRSAASSRATPAARSSAKCSAARAKPTCSRRGFASAYRSALSVSGGPASKRRSHSTNAPVPLAELDTTGRIGKLELPDAHRCARLRELSASRRSAFRRRTACSSTRRRATVSAADRRGRAAAASARSELAAATSRSIFRGFAHHVARAARRRRLGRRQRRRLLRRRRRQRRDLPDRARLHRRRGSHDFSRARLRVGHALRHARLHGLGGVSRAAADGRRRPGNSAVLSRPHLAHALRRLRHRVVPERCAGREVCNSFDPLLTRHIEIGSVGAELNVNLGVFSWDSPYRFRLGVVAPTYNRALFGQSAVQVYVVTGVYF